MTPAERAARIDQRITDLRSWVHGMGWGASDITRWLGDVEHHVQALLEDAERITALEEQLAAVRTELVAVDQERQIIADAAIHLIDVRRGATG